MPRQRGPSTGCHCGSTDLYHGPCITRRFSSKTRYHALFNVRVWRRSASGPLWDAHTSQAPGPAARCTAASCLTQGRHRGQELVCARPTVTPAGCLVLTQLSRPCMACEGPCPGGGLPLPAAPATSVCVRVRTVDDCQPQQTSHAGVHGGVPRTAHQILKMRGPCKRNQQQLCQEHVSAAVARELLRRQQHARCRSPPTLYTRLRLYLFSHQQRLTPGRRPCPRGKPSHHPYSPRACTME